MRTLLLCAVVVLPLAGCNIPGHVKYAKGPTGQWEAVEVVVPRADTSPADIEYAEDRLNGKR